MAILGVQVEEIVSLKVQGLSVLHKKKVKACKETFAVQNSQKKIVENLDAVKIVILPEEV